MKTIEVKRKQASDRDTKRDLRTGKQQIACLDSRLGINVGAKKERTRLGK